MYWLSQGAFFGTIKHNLFFVGESCKCHRNEERLHEKRRITTQKLFDADDCRYD